MYRALPLALLTIIAAALILPAPTAAQPDSPPDAVTVRAESPQPLHPEPDRLSPPLATVPFDALLAADAATPGRDWLRVTYDGQIGWLYFQGLAVVTGSIGALPVVADGVTQLPEPDALPAVEGAFFVAREGFGVAHDWQAWLPAGQRAESLHAARYVLTVRQEVGSSGYCASGDYGAYLTFSDFRVRLVDGESGAVLATRTFFAAESDPDSLTPYGRFAEVWAWAINLTP